jgi:hypothetical protein
MHLSLSDILQSLLDAFDQLFQNRHADRAFFTGSLQPRQDLPPVEDLPASIFLDHQGQGLLHSFIGSESALTMGAFPPPSDHISILTQSGVDNPVIHILAKWATQMNLPSHPLTFSPLPGKPNCLKRLDFFSLHPLAWPGR